MEINWTIHSGINHIAPAYQDYTGGGSSDGESVEIVFDCLQHETDPKIRAALVQQMFEQKSLGLEQILKTVWKSA